MSKRKRPDPLVEALQEGRSFTFTLPDGGAFASMRAVLKHGQALTFSPVTDHRDVQVGDIVLAKWRGGGYISHLVGEIQGDQFLIVNSVGKVNGWVHGDAILGRVTEMTEPEPPPSVPDMLEQLASAYHECIEHRGAAQDDAEMLLSVASDMRWYAARVGPERWDTLPRPNKWSFAQHLWHILKQVKGMANSGWPEPMMHLINHGKEHVGQVAEVFGLLEPSGGES